jgi:hypothetical protein
MDQESFAMKMFGIAAAGLVLLAGLAPAAPAAAQGQRRIERQVVRERVVVRTDRQRYRQRNRTVCRTVIRGGQRNRVCRTVRR